MSSKTAQEQVRELVGQDPVKGWDAAWQVRATPWGVGETQLALRELMNSGGVNFPRSGYALVPGCGRGYDAVYIASTLGLATSAIDISETAVIAANELLSNSNLPPSAQVKFQLRDFFIETFDVGNKGQFDLIYDYTFFVAIQPSRRSEWGKRMPTLVKSGGYLVTLVFPIDPPQDYGPPFFVRPEHYEEVLGEGWEKVFDKVPENSFESHRNRERMIVWRKA